MKEKFEDPRDAKKPFEDLARKHNDTPEREYKSMLANNKALALRKWEREGFPGTWDERWGRYREENRKLMSWLESQRRGFGDPDDEPRP